MIALFLDMGILVMFDANLILYRTNVFRNDHFERLIYHLTDLLR